MYVEGRLRTRDFTDGNGNRRFSTEIIAETVKLLGAARRDEADSVPDAEPESDGVPVTARRTARAKAA